VLIFAFTETRGLSGFSVSIVELLSSRGVSPGLSSIMPCGRSKVGDEIYGGNVISLAVDIRCVFGS
jgi:hypothetical protein